MVKHYAGIGSRETPEDILCLMRIIAHALEKRSWILRSGGASGADSAFESGVTDKNNKEIFLPWCRYNDNPSRLYGVSPEAFVMAANYHPNWGACKRGARKLHGRNCHIMLGEDLKTAVNLVICWTPGGKDIGGTGQALRVAKDQQYNIPVYNLADRHVLINLLRLLAL